MDKKIEPVEVYIHESGDHICLKQDDFGEEAVLTISPDQVDELIAWLQEARDEMQRGELKLQHGEFPRV
ncbi:hypothetical protein [Opitutus terrae]|uniref:Uncharacterized protein n=1 Tax=Opitutus terrae (strain DSM 11246 / JCM 15787 / PB90-1) TaxID=452637 RepID=B1ZV26_OPITP|nr:hypothetical protein [Opitutus terrae]ACB75995.1 hypothetical protein Oter_2714 [Opitutus terrae PB90-1]